MDDELDDEPSFISDWIHSLNDSDSSAAKQQWAEYREGLVARARKLTQGMPPHAMDPESLADSVFCSFLNGFNAGRLRSIEDLNELSWVLLASMRRKVADRVRKLQAAKRPDSRSRHSLSSAEFFWNVVSQSPAPEELAGLRDHIEYLISLLSDDQLQRIAVHRMQGLTCAEIADRENVKKITVDRKLRLIRDIWKHELEQ